MASKTTTVQAPRIGHKKSRNGCLKCRSRRVKCDETRPECKNCCRLGLQCRYAAQANSKSHDDSRGGTSVSGSSTSHSSAANKSSINFYAEAAQHDDEELGESAARRKMELRLLQFWTTKPGRAPERSTLYNWLRIWSFEVSALAVQHDHLLYALFAFAATQLSAAHHEDDELAMARQTYWTMALREQRIALSDMNNLDPQVTALAGYLIAMNSFSMLKQRTLEPYTPPLTWFETSVGAQALLPLGEAANIPDGPLRSLRDVLAPIWDDEALSVDMGVGHEYSRILNPYLSPSELSTLQSTRPYEAALRYISVLRRAIVEGETIDLLLRRVIMFPYRVPEFQEILREARPRALVVLACFFSLVAQSQTGYFVGDAAQTIAKREVAAIHAVLPEEWKELMERPMDETFGEIVLRPNSEISPGSVTS